MKALLTATICALAFVACRLGDGKSVEMKQCKAMREAVDAERAGDYDKAIESYREVASIYPHEALPSLQLALLLHEKRDYLGAIYNYKRYIETAKGDERQEFTIISNRIAVVEQLLSAKYVSTLESRSASSNVQLMHNVTLLNKKVAELEAQCQMLVSSNAALLIEVKTLNSAVAHRQLIIDKLSGRSGGGNPISLAGVVTPQTLTDVGGKKKTVYTYEVKQGDSLSEIAQVAYGDRKLWPRIKEANSDKIRDDTVKTGDVLIIPMP